MASDNSQLIGFLENLLLTPSSDFYLPKVLHNPGQGGIDPLKAAAVDLGSAKIEGIQIDVSVKNLIVRGLSNIQAIFNDGKPEIQVVGDRVTFHAKLPNTQPGYIRPSDVPDKIEMSGVLDVTLGGGKMPPGTISVTVRSIDDITGVFTATEQTSGDLGSAMVTFEKVTIAAEIGHGNFNIDVKLDTQFITVINDVLNKPKFYAAILDQLNTELAKPEVLNQLSQSATHAGRKALSKI